MRAEPGGAAGPATRPRLRCRATATLLAFVSDVKIGEQPPETPRILDVLRPTVFARELAWRAPPVYVPTSADTATAIPAAARPRHGWRTTVATATDMRLTATARRTAATAMAPAARTSC